MSRKNAASFSISSTGIGPPGPAPIKRPKSKTEEFLDYLQTLGYEPNPKTEKPEHFEYIFNDKDMFDAIKFLRRNVGPGNVVTEDEEKQFAILQEQGTVLTGEDLEKALQYDKLRKQREFEESEILKQRKETLRKQIAEQEARVNEAEKLNRFIDSTVLLAKKAKTLEDYRNKEFMKKIEYYNEQIYHKKKAVDSNIKNLCEILDNIIEAFSTIQETESQFLYKQNWDEIIGKEEQLLNSVRLIASSYGTGLMNHAVEVDALQEDEINQLVKGNVNDINRLKNILVYETHQKLGLQAEAHKAQSLTAKWKDILKEESRILGDSGSVQTKRVAEIERRISLLEIHLKDLQSKRSDDLVSSSMKSMNEEIKVLQDAKETAKARVNEFLDFINQILSSQSARLDISAYIVKLETTKIKEFLSKLKLYADDVHLMNEEKILMSDIPSNLSHELKSLLKTYQYSPSLASSYETLWKILVKIEEKDFEESQHQDSLYLQRLQMKKTQLKDMTESKAYTWGCYKDSWNNNEHTKGIQEFKERYAKAETELIEDPEVKENRIKNSIEEKKCVIEEARRMLD